MPFTAGELENIANAALDFHLDRGRVFAQDRQDKPLLRRMMAKQKTFPGGKEYLTQRVKGAVTTSIMGFEHDDTVTYANPANIKESRWPYKLIHWGIQTTMHELIKDGISIVDTATGKNVSRHTEREKTMLANILDDKIDDMIEGGERGMNEMFWLDGSQDAKQVPGIQSFILDDPTSATVVGGIDQSANTWWRNRASLGINAATPSNQNLVNTLQEEWLQLRRYGGNPDLFICGSDFIHAYEQEIKSKGNYSETGFAGRTMDGSIGGVAFKGVELLYDPTLDDMGRSKYGYLLDTKTIHPKVVEGENLKRHNPARPEDKYVMYRAITWVGGLVCSQRNANGVYSIS